MNTHDLRGPATAGEVPAPSPGGDAAGALAQGAPVLHRTVVVRGGQGRSAREVEETCEVLLLVIGIAAALFVAAGVAYVLQPVSMFR